MPRLTVAEKTIRALESRRDSVMAAATAEVASLNHAIQTVRDEQSKDAQKRAQKESPDAQ